MDHHTLLPMFTELRGPRVVLRPPQQHDAQVMFAAIMESRDAIRPWESWISLYERGDGLDETRRFIAQCQANWIVRDDFNLAILRGDDGEFIGSIGLHPRNWGIPSFEIGYWQRTGLVGHGYITEAARLFTDFAFTDLGAQRVMIRCDARNTRSANIARRLGFVQEGLLRNDGAPGPDGLVRDTLIFSRIPTDPPMP